MDSPPSSTPQPTPFPSQSPSPRLKGAAKRKQFVALRAEGGEYHATPPKQRKTIEHHISATGQCLNNIIFKKCIENAGL